ncbi:hypothetical protein C7M84_002213 [Penaeus vannamei]|uniref:Ig-like domain-containing protein n=1 Tax=Penaeus vannamei TaxID=6689 RepID=A0A423TRK2_PENVA|nr:hypothetical protein C7M84_002213 [Penaeus vannamei]
MWKEFFPPLWVRLLSSRDPLSAGRQYVVVCQAVGAKPPANITWYLGPTRLSSHFESSLRLTPTVADAGQVLACVSDSRTIKTRMMMDDHHQQPESRPPAGVENGLREYHCVASNIEGTASRRISHSASSTSPTSPPTSFPTYSPTLFPKTFPTLPPQHPPHIPHFIPHLPHFPNTSPTLFPITFPHFIPQHFPHFIPHHFPTLFPNTFPHFAPQHPPPNNIYPHFIPQPPLWNGLYFFPHLIFPPQHFLTNNIYPTTLFTNTTYSPHTPSSPPPSPFFLTLTSSSPSPLPLPLFLTYSPPLPLASHTPLSPPPLLSSLIYLPHLPFLSSFLTNSPFPPPLPVPLLFPPIPPFLPLLSPSFSRTHLLSLSLTYSPFSLSSSHTPSLFPPIPPFFSLSLPLLHSPHPPLLPYSPPLPPPPPSPDSPVCRENQMMYHGAARYEQVNIPCELDAHPPPISFRWTFNNSGESVDIPQNHIMVEGSRATVSYTPNTELDYGTLLCWGSNSVGVQRHPCVFHVFPAGPPDPVHNCSVYNLSVTVVNVRCLAGFDGGLPQTFILELYDPHTNVLVGNTTNTVPKFSVPGLAPGVGLLGVVYSTNAKGRGQMINLQVFTLKDVAERRTAAVKPPPHASVSSVRITAIIAVVMACWAASSSWPSSSAPS